MRLIHYVVLFGRSLCYVNIRPVFFLNLYELSSFNSDFVKLQAENMALIKGNQGSHLLFGSK